MAKRYRDAACLNRSHVSRDLGCHRKTTHVGLVDVPQQHKAAAELNVTSSDNMSQ
jgi:hypothetical protein